MVALPLIVSLGLATALAPLAVRSLRRAGLTAPNYRGASLPRPTGVVVSATVLLALPLLWATEAVTGVDLVSDLFLRGAAFVVGVSALGLLDDLFGASEGAPRGVRAHARALARGRPTTGAVKAVGTAVLAVVALSGDDRTALELALGAATLTLAAHVWNLLDLRPGRAPKALVVLAAALTLGSGTLAPLWALGPVLAPLLVLLPLDLRERGMLGDAGASAAGAVAGLWLVLTLPPPGQAVALAALAAIAVLGELRSLNALVDASPALRRLDSLGRA